ncbi:MAG TPA: PKD domain-containing protein [Thermoplasmata archaeon]|nr:PKD domain-containing protein [Thermoplasmata archaeon]
MNGITLPGSGGCTITSIKWSWGDSISGKSWFPATHVYNATGNYSVTAVTHQSDGQVASNSTLIAISTTCLRPKISLSTTSTSGLVASVSGTAVAGSSYCVIGAVTWSWGDGQTSTSAFPATHRYSLPGSYLVAVTAHQSDRQTATVLGNVSVSTGGGWGVHPSGRVFFSMAYDAKNQYVVLFGGQNSTSVLADTWKYAGGVWTQLHPASSPGAREQAAMAYDAKDGYVVLFGGIGPNFGSPNLGDTWKFVGGAWTQLHPSTSPSARSAAMLTYDAKLGKLVLFGGGNSGGKLNDTWTFSAGNWTQLNLTTSPSSRVNGGFAYDASNGWVILYGGAGAARVNDTWAFNGTGWTRLGVSHHPTADDGTAAAYDPNDHSVIVFGGSNALQVLNQTWAFNSNRWTNLTAASGSTPPARQYAGLVYDVRDGCLVLFGGLNGVFASPSSFYSDTWTFT